MDWKKYHAELSEERKLLEEMVEGAVHGIIAKQFPKTCGKCKTLYASEADYILRTQRLGNAKEERDIGLFHFYRHCACESTMMLILKYDELHPYQLYCLMDHVHNLANLAKHEVDNVINAGRNIQEDWIWKYLKGLSKEKLNSPRDLSGQDWREIGLCLFRDRYNNGLRKDHAKT